MSLLVVFLFFCPLIFIAQPNDVSSTLNRHLLAVGALPPQKVPDNDLNNHPAPAPPAVINVTSHRKEQEKVQQKPESTTERPKDVEHNPYPTTPMESGTLLRGVAVIVALTTLVLIYMALKTYCNAKTNQPGMVRKYGVRTRRSDIEMTPLPLDEDEDDETLFDVNSTHR